jgi:SAM-dependent methyltransferase
MDAAATRNPFRFYDNREKYLLFVTTCSEKRAIAERVGAELGALAPEPPALRIFDAGAGDGTVLMRVLRDLHRRHPTVPIQVVAKEISLEDVRLCLEKLPDRLAEHPALSVTFTNMLYAEAPSLTPGRSNAAAALNWWEAPLEGRTAHDFDLQIAELQGQLTEGWQVRASERTGNPVYVTPSVLTVYRADQRFVLDRTLPRRGAPLAGYDLVLASQPYRARQPAAGKARNVLAPLARALKPGGRMVVVQSTGHDPGMEIIRRIWPDEDPFRTPRHVLIQALREALAGDPSGLVYEGGADDRALFRFHLHALPSELGESIGTSTLLAAWNAAIYVAQIEDARLSEAMSSGAWLEATRDVLHKYGELWFLDESFVVSRPRG